MSFDTFKQAVQPADLTPLIDHTNLFPTASSADIAQLCAEAQQHGFASVCVTPSRVSYAAQLLKESPVLVCTVIGFPLGATTRETKAYEAEHALKQGAHEIDMVVNNGFLHEGQHNQFLDDILSVARSVSQHGGRVLKCIIEAGYDTPENLDTATTLVYRAAESVRDVHFFTKTSTGMALSKFLVAKHGREARDGAQPDDLELIARVHEREQHRDPADILGPSVGIKASGGIREYATALTALYAMGARTREDLTSDRYRLGVGTPSGMKIVTVQSTDPAAFGCH